MTIGTVSAPNASGPVRSAALPRAPRLTFGGVIRSEWIKFSSLRSIRITLIITVVMGLGLSTLMAFLQSDNLRGPWSGIADMPAEGVDGLLTNYLLQTASFSAPFLALIFGVLGVFAISSEYSSGMILSTLAAVPKRTPVFVAKAIVLALISGITAIMLVGGGLLLGVAFYPDAVSLLRSGTVLSGCLGSVLYLVLIALFAYGVAGLLRSTAGGIAVVAGVTFVLPIAFQVLMITDWEWVPVAFNYLPMQLGSVLSSGIAPNGMIGISMGTGDVPGFGVALLAMAIWAAVAVIPAAVAFKARDAK